MIVKRIITETPGSGDATLHGVPSRPPRPLIKAQKIAPVGDLNKQDSVSHVFN